MSIPRDTYIGEPGYPAPWTTKKPREGLRDIDEAKIVSLSPDVCLTPIGKAVVPIPYPIVDFCGHDDDYTPSVRFTGKKAMVLRSRTTHVHGDAPGTKKGVKSGTVESISEPIGHADQLRAEGSNVIRHLDRFKMNSGNTVGEAQFVRSTQTYYPPVDDDPVPGSLRWMPGSNEGRVISDASPEPLIMGAQYAQALPQTAPYEAADHVYEEHVIVSIRHEVVDRSYETSVDTPEYKNTFEALPARGSRARRLPSSVVGKTIRATTRCGVLQFSAAISQWQSQVGKICWGHHCSGSVGSA